MSGNGGRALGVFLIGLGTLTVAAGGSLTRFGHHLLYGPMVLGLLLIFAGYRRVTSPGGHASVTTVNRTSDVEPENGHDRCYNPSRGGREGTMAISLEELTAVALEGSVGPLTLAVGAGALAVALAAGSTRPLRRIGATSVLAAGRAGQLNPIGWIEVVRRQWSSLVDEARAEYEASRAPASSAGAPSIVIATATGAVPEAGSVIVVPGAVDGPVSLEVPEGSRTRDPRGRFVRRATNGVQPE